MHTAKQILAILDRCAATGTFPMLDNGYVYLAAARLSLHRSAADWAMVVEVFGFSPRAGLPDLHVHAFGSRLHDRNPPEQYVSREAYDGYLASHPHDDARFFDPVAPGDWQDPEDAELVAEHATSVTVRGVPVDLPVRAEYARHGIALQDGARVRTFELCRWLAAVRRDAVLATPAEQRVSVPPDAATLLQLDDWHHPDLVNDERPGELESFVRLAQVLETDDAGRYRPARPGNTHWRFWPEGGML